MFRRKRLYCPSVSAVRVIVSASLLLALISPLFFPFAAFAREKPKGVEGAKGSHEEIIDITADEIGYDLKYALATAKGNVTVLFKSFRITGDLAEYDEGKLVVVIKGNAKLEDTQEGTVFLADKIVFLLEEEKMEAEGGVSLRYKDGEVLASGEKVSYFGVDKRAIVEGDASVEIAGKVFSASVITVFLDEERVLAEGGTRTVIPRDELSP
jgi:lipopolysaccharide export system protein LptA